jgi:hypothetical protein
MFYRKVPNLAQNLFWIRPTFSYKTAFSGKVVKGKDLANLMS